MRQELLARYGEKRLPRYTSYPTAPHFASDIDGPAYAEWLAGLPGGLSGSLYLHVPFCRAMCWYCGCHTTVALRDGPVEAYCRRLETEIGRVGERLSRPLAVRHVQFGGGTPSIVGPERFVSLMDRLRQAFAIAPDAEVAVELDPRHLEPETVEALVRSGVTRASLGVQSFDARVQAAINRMQGFEATSEAVERLRAAGIAAINIDLVYGLPHQDIASCLDTVERCLTLKPDRFAVFGYAHVPDFKKHQRKIREEALPGAAARAEQADAIAARIGAAGYRTIGFDHFALPDDPMTRAAERGALHRNFQGYTTDAAEALLGFGASAIGRLPQGYVQNATVIGDYIARIDAGGLATAKGYRMTRDDHLRAALIERLMCDFRLDAPILAATSRKDPAILDGAEAGLLALERDGIIRRNGGAIEMAADCRPLVRAVAACFDAHLGAAGRRFSRAV